MAATAIFFSFATLSSYLHPSSSLIESACANEGNKPCYTLTLPSIYDSQVLAFATFQVVFVNRFLPPLLQDHTPFSDSTRRTIMAFTSGFEMALGLLISGMASPAKVSAFFNVFTPTRWDPSLALVFFFGVLPNIIVFQSSKPGQKVGKEKPNFAPVFSIPNLTLEESDWRFYVGASVFGLVWGLNGICPGPAILRAVLQPAWGVLWVGAFSIGYSWLF
jgi:uncharacterized protein